LEVLYDVPIFIHEFGAGVAEDVQTSLLTEVVEEGIGYDVVGFREVVVKAAVEGRDLFWTGWREAITQFVNQEP